MSQEIVTAATLATLTAWSHRWQGSYFRLSMGIGVERRQLGPLVEGVLEATGGRHPGPRAESGSWMFAGIPYRGVRAGARGGAPPQPPHTVERDPTHRVAPMAPQVPAIVGAGVPGDPTEQSTRTASTSTSGRRPRRRPAAGHGLDPRRGVPHRDRVEPLVPWARSPRKGDVVVVTVQLPARRARAPGPPRSHYCIGARRHGRQLGVARSVGRAALGHGTTSPTSAGIPGT